jgi:hypothetical protein
MTKCRRKQEATIMASEAAGGKGLSHGRYYAEYVRVTSRSPEEQLQEALDAKEGKEWHLVGVAGGMQGGGVVLFWDTTRPSFGRTDR